MITKGQVKLVRSLKEKKFRDEYGLFVAEGDKCIEELKKAFELVLYVNEENATLKEIEQMSSLKTPQGSIAVFRKGAQCTMHNAELGVDNAQCTMHDGGLVLALDGVQDPGNMGTIIRTADWFGVREIVCSKDTADCYNPKVVQATMGALARVRVRYVELTRWLAEVKADAQSLLGRCAAPVADKGDLRAHHAPSQPSGLEHQNEGEGVEIYGTLLDGQDMYEVLTNHQSPIINHQSPIIVMGNEGKGISEEVRKLITCPIRIPSYPKEAETSESLNVAIATGIVLAEVRRVDNAQCTMHGGRVNNEEKFA